MKTTTLFCFFLMSVFAATAQDFDAWSALKFSADADYKTHERTIMDVSNYILETPRSENDEHQKLASKLLLSWMDGTPDYSFAIDKSIQDVMKDNFDVLTIYMAAMTNYVLLNKDMAKDVRAVKLNSFKTMLNYCEKESNGIKHNKGLKKAIAAKNDGTLEKYLNL